MGAVWRCQTEEAILERLRAFAVAWLWAITVRVHATPPARYLSDDPGRLAEKAFSNLMFSTR